MVSITDHFLSGSDEPDSVDSLRYFVDNVPCGIYCCRNDGDYTLLYTNDYFYKTLGGTREEAEAGGHTSNSSFSIDRAHFLDVHARIEEHLARQEYQFELEDQCLTMDGRIIWILAQCRYISHADVMIGVIIDITERKRIEEELYISCEEKKMAIEHGERNMVDYDIGNKTLYIGDLIAKLQNIPSVIEDVPDSLIRKGAICESCIDTYRDFYRDMRQGIPSGECTVRLTNIRSNQFVWYHLKYNTIFNNDHHPVRAVILFEDITEQLEKETAYKCWYDLFQKKRENSIAYYEYNLTGDYFERVEGELAGKIPINQPGSFEDSARYAAEHYVYKDDRDKYLKVMNRAYLFGKNKLHENIISMDYRRHLQAEKKLFWARCEIQMIEEPTLHVIKVFLMMTDIDKEKKEELKQLDRMERDPLTGLYNRSTMVEKISCVLDESSAEDRHALVIMDVDHFKWINDHYGHVYGDDVLHMVAQGILGNMRADDIAGRLGGDEFVLFFKNIRQEEALTAKLLSVLNRARKNLSGSEEITESSGIAFYPDHGLTFDELYKNADTALYRAKEAGRNRCEIFK